jgi:predicted ATP-dependent endonuclease of OLD family
MDQDYIAYQNASGRTHALGLLGDGFSSVFRVAYTLFSSTPGSVVVLDEPELSLHPEAQKSLYKLLAELAEDRQIIIATHSPYMVNWSDLAKGARLFRLSLNREGFSRSCMLSSGAVASVLPVVQTDIRNRKLFDVLAKEVFFRSTVVFCEGQEDVHYIENYLEGRGERALPLFGYGSGGASLIDSWLSLAVSLKIRCAAIFDANEVIEADRVARKYSANDEVRIFVLPAEDIRDKEKGDQTLLGVFDRRGQINEKYADAFHEMLAELSAWLAGGGG